MDPEFEQAVARLRAAYRRMDRREQAQVIDRLWSLVPKFEAPEPEAGPLTAGPRTTRASIDCPVCGAALTVMVSG